MRQEAIRNKQFYFGLNVRFIKSVYNQKWKSHLFHWIYAPFLFHTEYLTSRARHISSSSSDTLIIQIRFMLHSTNIPLREFITTALHKVPVLINGKILCTIQTMASILKSLVHFTEILFLNIFTYLF